MKMNYYIKRTINNKLKLAVIILLMAYPLVDYIFLLFNIRNGGSVYHPGLCSFLAGNTNSITQVLLLWFLPLYLLLIAADDCIEDYHLGYRSLLMTKWGKHPYLGANIIKGFCFGFFVVFISLAINLVMTQITFAGGTFTPFDKESIASTPSLSLAFQHPLWTNIKYILVTSLLSGIVGMGASAAALAIHNRFIVYPVVFLMWYIPFSFEKSIMLAIQPFTEYFIKDAGVAVGFVVAINIFAVVFAYIKVIKIEKV